MERRTFLKLMAASFALAGMAGCTKQPPEQILPYVRQPENFVPGKPLFFATTMTLGGRGRGLLVESHLGRPTKIEGNPLHPASLGATDLFAQAAVLDLYDPDRMQTLTYLGEIRPWSSFIGAMHQLVTARAADRGAGLHFLTESICSPTLAAQMTDLLARLPDARWHQWDPSGERNAAGGVRLAFGADAAVQYAVDRAAVIVCLDADLLASGGGSLRYARQFAQRRRPDAAGNRLYAVESMPTSTGSRADHRLPLRSSQVESVARRLAADLGVASVNRGGDLPAAAQAWVNAVRGDLDRHRGSSLIVAGEGQPPVVHALAHAMNAALGNTGQTVFYTDPIEAQPVDHAQSLRELTSAMSAGRVDALVIMGGNPVFTAPADLGFAEAMGRVAERIHLSLHANETSALCHWQVPEAHFLEAWSDARAFDGTVSIVQPLIAPLYGGKAAHEVLAAFSDQPEQRPYDAVRQYWQRQHASGDFEAFWRRTVHDGVMAGTALAPKPLAVRTGIFAETPTVVSGGGIEVVFRTDPTVYDGRFANNGWLQELPKPITALTWDNAILTSPAMMQRLGVSADPAFVGGERGNIEAPIAELRLGSRSVRGALFPVAGHPDEAVTVHLGYGRSRAGHVGENRGFDAGALRTSSALWIASGAQLAPTGDSFPLACVQYHHLMEGRDIVRVTPRAELRAAAGQAGGAAARGGEGAAEGQEQISLFPIPPHDDPYAWGMSIDLNACTGCNACVVACQAENNIPVVGKDQVLAGARCTGCASTAITRGPPKRPAPISSRCRACTARTAPCEVVCPVGATVHSPEGLNEMVYNRCVGTRYCSNNCPYKVRRFNFFCIRTGIRPA